VRQELAHHVLAVAVRLEDHFLAQPIPDELDVRLGTEILPCRTRSGSGHRHPDGTYRFVGVPDGPQQIVIASDDRWMVLEPPPAIVLPLADPAEAMVVQLWPTPVQTTPPGMTAVRGKLVGAPAQTIGRRVEIDVGTATAIHHTTSSSHGELLFLLPGRLELDTAGLVPITVRVDGATVTGGELIAGQNHIGFSGASLAIAPGRESRVRFHVT
jgi:hypothetical protein